MEMHLQHHWHEFDIAGFVRAAGDNLDALELKARSGQITDAMTKCSSSEFGIRFFLIDSPGRTLSVLKSWMDDSNQHVRRLVSEGTRPRLPWAMQLPEFIKGSAAVIDLLESLKDDNQEYVRRSVANNLNDIAKDHPDLVAEIAAKWMRGASQKHTKLIRHACRSLIKKGHKKPYKYWVTVPPEFGWPVSKC